MFPVTHGYRGFLLLSSLSIMITAAVTTHLLAPEPTSEPPPPPVQVNPPESEPPPSPAQVNPPESASPPDPLAGKTADESWAWALSLVPDLAKLTPRPDTAGFSKLNMHKGRLTLYAPKLTLGMAENQPPPCLPLPMILKDGSLVTRVSLDGRTASPDLADDYTIVRLGVDFNDHDTRTEGYDFEYRSGGSDPLLSEVGRGVIRYDGAPASYVVRCEAHEETHTCSDAKRVCRWCTPFVLPVPDGHFGQFASSMGQRQTCDPCPPDPVGQDLAALNRVVRNRSFLDVFPGAGPSFYTSQAACKKALVALHAQRQGSLQIGWQ
jgi:hypothetical protein